MCDNLHLCAGPRGPSFYPFLTSYERDPETELDYAKARYYAPTQGRFISFDALIPHEAFGLPQAWNRYSYCLNNPLTLVDPTGLNWYAKKGTNQPEWFDERPGDEYDLWQTYNYYGGAEYGWVHLDRYSSYFNYGYASEYEAMRSQSLTEVWTEFKHVASKTWTWSYIKSDSQRAWNVVDGHHRLQAATELGIREVRAEAVQLPYKGYKSLEYLFKF
jgi:RHS repeat-associated protein